MDVTTRMHTDELDIDEALVRRLLADQFPVWADLRLCLVEPIGTVNAACSPIGRHGSRLAFGSACGPGW